MTWFEDLVAEYLSRVPSKRVSYLNFLTLSEADIREHIHADTDVRYLDSRLYSCFKASLPQDAPRKALRRLGLQPYWQNLRPSPVDVAKQNYEASALRLLDQARQTQEAHISERIQGRATATATETQATTLLRRDNESDASLSRGLSTTEHGESSANITVSDDPEDPFEDHSHAERVRSLILKYRIDSNHVPTLHKQDLLFYGIIDIVPASSTVAHKVIDEADFQEIINISKTKQPRARNLPQCSASQVKEYACTIMEPVSAHSMLRTTLKRARQELRSSQDHAKWKQKTVKIMKLIRDQYSPQGSCFLIQPQGEMHYIATFLAPLLKDLFKGCDDLSWHWGDQSLPASKEEEQRAQKDNERRSKGTAPDAIIRIESFNLAFSLMEVTGPPHLSDHAHFVGDRIKLAKNLKSMLKSIRRQSRTGDSELYTCIKLYGIQTYLNKVYVYSFSEPIRGIYVFDRACAFDVCCPNGMLPMFIPKFLKHLWKLKNLLLSSMESIEDYINSDSLSDSSDATSDSRDTVYISPKKRKLVNT